MRRVSQRTEQERIEDAKKHRLRELRKNPTKAAMKQFEEDFGHKPSLAVNGRAAEINDPVFCLEGAMKWEDIASEIGVSRERARQIFASGVRKLRRKGVQVTRLQELSIELQRYRGRRELRERA